MALPPRKKHSIQSQKTGKHHQAKAAPLHRRRRTAALPKTQSTPRLIALNKPFDVLCQFQDEEGRKTLKDFVPIEHVYPAGRLDRDSEGLVLLTNHGPLQAHIADPAHKMEKTYWVQVEGMVQEHHLKMLRDGVALKDGLTKPAHAQAMQEPDLWQREPPVRFRKSVPTSWLSLTIAEGKNRQVRRMTAAVGLPTLRLIRVQIGHWKLNALQPGEWRDEIIAPPANA